jgi:hypothetical protein
MLALDPARLETIDSELRLVATLRRAARERGGLLPSIDVADALLEAPRAVGKVDQQDEPQPHPAVFSLLAVSIKLDADAGLNSWPAVGSRQRG